MLFIVDIHILFFLVKCTIFVWQIMDDPSPSPPKQNFSPEFCSFIVAYLQKDPYARPTAGRVANKAFKFCVNYEWNFFSCTDPYW